MGTKEFWFKLEQASIRHPDRIKIRKLSDLSEEERKNYLQRKEEFLAARGMQK